MNQSFESRPCEELQRLLSKPNTKEALHKVQRKILLAAARDHVGSAHDDGIELERYIDRKNCDIRRDFRLGRSEYEPVLKDRVIEKLSRPHCVTLGELSRLFFEHLIVQDNEFDDAYERFASAAWGFAEDIQQTTPFPIARLSRGPVLPLDDIGSVVSLSDGEPLVTLKQIRQANEQRNLNAIPPGTELWGSTLESGPKLKVVGCLPGAYSWERDPYYRRDEMLVFAAVEGEMSPSAAQRLVIEIKPVVRSICRSYDLLFLRSSVLPDVDRIEPLVEDNIGLWRSFIRDSLEYYYTAIPQRGTVALRIQNAIYLIVEADRQKRRGIGHALCMTALEALLCKSQDGISKELAENTAVLLEPDKSLRRRGRDVVKELYDKRSRVLHGDVLDVDRKTLRSARLLCAAALKALIDWSRHARSFVDPENTDKTLFEELTRVRDNAENFDRVFELHSVRKLWNAQ